MRNKRQVKKSNGKRTFCNIVTGEIICRRLNSKPLDISSQTEKCLITNGINN